jgi:RNA polymerase-binding transcription factor DksA
MRVEKTEISDNAREAYRESISNGPTAEETEMSTLTQMMTERLAGVQRIESEIREIDAAIQRIYSGTYGICEETGSPIEAIRLRNAPQTRYSKRGEAIAKQKVEAERHAAKLFAYGDEIVHEDAPVVKKVSDDDEEEEVRTGVEKKETPIGEDEPDEEAEKEKEKTDKPKEGDLVLEPLTDDDDDKGDEDDKKEAVEVGFQ